MTTARCKDCKAILISTCGEYVTCNCTEDEVAIDAHDPHYCRIIGNKDKLEFLPEEEMNKDIKVLSHTQHIKVIQDEDGSVVVGALTKEGIAYLTHLTLSNEFTNQFPDYDKYQLLDGEVHMLRIEGEGARKIIDILTTDTQIRGVK